ncbi:hypothetical protein HYE67_005569 [Fusarium culmorum]|uniref:Alpha/beta hydrolase fold-3 domain-containing protein n=1 Tax=Fusarium culmorum TaxID=5516 RepID=A0A7S8HW06_FUSCU|nr:hypothetical protein HYE67_005569 [Fusarium culmorum]
MSSYAESWLKFEEGIGGVRPVLRGTAEDMRTQYNGLGSALAFLSSPVSDTQVKVTEGDVSEIKYRIYKPRGETKKLPIGVFYHSGGLVVGHLDAEDNFCRIVALRSGVVMVNVDYRLSPEHKSPAHVEDAAYRDAKSIGGDSSQMFTIGTSAGGGLALSTVRKVILGQTNLPIDAIKGVVTLCPLTFHYENIPAEYQPQHLSYQEHGEDVPIVDKVSLSQMFANTDIRPDDRDYFPILDQGCPRPFPPTYVVTCGQDALRDDGKILSNFLSSVGIPTKTNHYESTPHCFWIVPTLPETNEFVDALTSGIQWIMSRF